MTTEQNKSLMRRFLEASTSTDQASLKAFLAPDFVAHLADGPQDREAFIKHNGLFAAAFSDIHIEVKDLIAEGDMVAARSTWRATQSGTFQGIPASGKKIAISAMVVERIKDGKMVEHWSLFDQLSMLRQLGIVPAATPAR